MDNKWNDDTILSKKSPTDHDIEHLESEMNVLIKDAKSINIDIHSGGELFEHEDLEEPVHFTPRELDLIDQMAKIIQR